MGGQPVYRKRLAGGEYACYIVNDLDMTLVNQYGDKLSIESACDFANFYLHPPTVWHKIEDGRPKNLQSVWIKVSGVEKPIAAVHYDGMFTNAKGAWCRVTHWCNRPDTTPEPPEE